MRNLSAFLKTAMLSIILTPAMAAAGTEPSGVGEKAFYAAPIVTSAPFRVCDLDLYAHIKEGETTRCFNGSIFDQKVFDAISPQQLVDKNCPGATVDSYDVLQWWTKGSPPKAVIRFTIPPQGCKSPGRVY